MARCLNSVRHSARAVAAKGRQSTARQRGAGNYHHRVLRIRIPWAKTARTPQRQSSLAFDLRLCRWRDGRCVWHERSAAGNLRSPAPLDCPTFSRHATGLLLARQRDRHDRLLAGRSVDPRSNALLRAFTRRGRSGNFSWTRTKPPHAQLRVSKVRARGADLDRCDLALASNAWIGQGFWVPPRKPFLLECV